MTVMKDTISHKELRLFIEMFSQLYDKSAPRKNRAYYIQLQIFMRTGEKVPLERIIRLQPFKKITKKKVIEDINGKPVVKKRLRYRSRN